MFYVSIALIFDGMFCAEIWSYSLSALENLGVFGQYSTSRCSSSSQECKPVVHDGQQTTGRAGFSYSDLAIVVIDTTDMQGCCNQNSHFDELDTGVTWLK
jgi:hypothetical protein